MKKKSKFLKISHLYMFDEKQIELLEKFQIRTKYETEPLHGDPIYSISLKDKEFPFWIYGRNIVFIDETKVMVEAVKPNTWGQGGINTVIIDTKKDMYARFKNWYRDISIKDNQIKLTNRYEEIEEILGGFDELEWIAL